MKPRRAEYTPLDFNQWRAANSLTLTPKFQRRGVWTPGARSFFIDSLLREMPVPPIYLRETQSLERDRVIREVVDGQQRIAAVLDFLDGKYRLAKSLSPEWAGRTFAELPHALQDRVTTFPFSTEIFHGIGDLEVLEIFSRLNTYSVSLNPQELRNGRFFGLFKQSVYSLAFEHLEFWRRHRIFTERSIARMNEAEFVGEVMIAFLAGMQDKKKSMDSFYATYDDTYPERTSVEKQFRETVDEINEATGEALSESVFRRPPMLYSLFCVVFHRRHGMPKSDLTTPKRRLNSKERVALREAVDSLSAHVEAAGAGEATPKRYNAFVQACLRQTDNIKPRETRFEVLYETAFA